MSKVYPRRAYADASEVHAGDVVRLLAGNGSESHLEPAAFSDAIVVEINATTSEVTLARPHVYLLADGTVKHRLEQYQCPLSMLIERHHVLTTGHLGGRDNRLRPLEAHFTVLVPWSDTPTQWHPTEKTGPLSVLCRGAFRTRREAEQWANEKLQFQPYELRYIDPMSDPETLAAYESCTGHPLDLGQRLRDAYRGEP